VNQLVENIASAAQTLQHIIQETRQSRDEQGFSIFASPAQISALQLMQQKTWVNAHWPIAWPDWPPGLGAKIVALWQKVVRRMLAWYINPIVKQQNEFNQATLRAIQVLSKETLELRADHLNGRAEQQARLDELMAHIDTLRQTLQQREQ
jgi:hypothetical protein